jgi:patatin-related protein
MSAERPNDSGGSSQPRAELRLAATFTGGVSLAVWMGGMAREMNLLLSASWQRQGQPYPATTAQGASVREKYGALLELLNIDCSLDILSGTSAGGINAAILGFANVQRFDLDGLRELWFREGSLDTLLRNPADQYVPSLLYGDQVLLKGLRDGLLGLAKSALGPHELEHDPTRVFIATTLLTGKASVFEDEYGTIVNDTDHHGLFSFKSQQLTTGNVAALALAARCSASFPAAFEVGFIPIGAAGNDPETHPNMADFTDTRPAQFAADGGLLANRPLGPAVQAVFDREAGCEVRRVLAFVVPTVDGGDPPPPSSQADPPSLRQALMADVNALRSGTISADLAAITAHNHRVRIRNDARQQLAVLGAPMARLGLPFYPRYRKRRADSIAEAAADEVMKRRAAQGLAVGFDTDASDAFTAARAVAEDALPQELPASGEYLAMNAAGREALDEGRATVLALVSRAYQLPLSAEQKVSLGVHRLAVTEAMPAQYSPTETDTVANALNSAPELAAPSAQAATAALALLNANMSATETEPWEELAAAVVGLAGLLGAPAEEGGAPSLDGEFLWELLEYLTGPAGGNSLDLVAARLFDLHVARYVMQPEMVLADQALELIQMSSDTRTSLDPRKFAKCKLTGLQLDHFGAFYKASWRANDWMWGRLDGAGWLVHVLLDPPRLYKLASEAEDAAVFQVELQAALTEIAGSPAPPGIWAAGADPSIQPEMAFLLAGTPPTATVKLNATSIWVATGIQRLIASEELPHIAEQVSADQGNGAAEGPARDFVSAYSQSVGGAPANGSYPVVPEAAAAAVLNKCLISAEKIADERNTSLFKRTAFRVAALAAKMLNPGPAAPAPVRHIMATARILSQLANRLVNR